MDIDSLFKPEIAAAGVQLVPSAPSKKRPSEAGALGASQSNSAKKMKMPVPQDFEASDDSDSSVLPRGWTRMKKEDLDKDVIIAPDEDDDRFMGDGLSDEQRRILELVDAAEDIPEAIDLSTLKKMVLKFEKAVNKNQELRMKHGDRPQMFMESEADLDEETKGLTAISSVPHHYPVLVELGTLGTLLSLLSHENTDVAMTAVEVLNELTDEDVVGEIDENEAAVEGMSVLVKALVENQALELLVQNMSRLNENNAEDKQGIFNTLGVVENMISVDPSVAEKVVAQTQLMPFLLARIGQRGFDSNRQYASELLSILLSSSSSNRRKLGELNGIDTLLVACAYYKKRDPTQLDEVELMENIFDCLCSALSLESNKAQFLESDGIELMLIMLREKKMSRMKAIKVLDHALMRAEQDPGADSADADAVASPESSAVHRGCYRFIEALGLKTLFAIFMRKGLKAYKKEYKTFSEREDEEHVMSIMASLLKYASSESTHPGQRIRVFNKFTEGDGEKVDRLIEMYGSYQAKISAQDSRSDEDKNDDDNDDDDDDDDGIQKYLDRLENGLFTLQLVALVAAFVCSGDEGEQASSSLRCRGEEEDTGLLSG
ncbi:Catenin-beta-like protein [Polychytrium aggregatum]|uniref:Catenin-beta-like protein n=1 Tax=Polychytrium aggregatum TaxID=110093 RepID=UPI0022FEA295|nr:Catenin-beta-like protein [Polychytrium aggregatum]KAI9204682.1 Catenin-beta-like protein [Polychytrium aggregatum]